MQSFDCGCDICSLSILPFCGDGFLKVREAD
jgi:hypothetical protein